MVHRNIRRAFSQFDYVNPNAPKGGEIRLAETGGWDTLNPFTVKGEAAGGSDLPFETLMIESADEPFSEYGLLAESIEFPADRSWVAFTLRPKARWHDGKPITADDVVFSFDILKTKGHPRYRFYYAAVDKVEKVGERKVRFTFKPGDNRELPLILGQLPVLPKHYWKGRDFAATTLEPPLGSGPYKAGPFETGRTVTWVRVKDYWGADLPVRRGQYNFDRIRYDSYRDTTVALEAFKAGEYDWRLEMEAKKWATGYQDWSGLKDGRGLKEAFPNQRPAGMQAYVYNLRRPLFQDAKVREALAYAFDFEWTNKTLFYGQYKRTTSFFANSDMAATGLPGPKELEVLEPLRDKVPPQVFTSVYKPPETEGDGNIRANLRAAMRLLEEAGWTVQNGKLVKDGRPFVFEILLVQPVWERIALPFARNLERLGIEANVRVVDTAQYKNRVDQYDYDMVVQVWGQSQSPGNEQASFWGSAAADAVGGQNLAGIKNPAIDALVAALIAAPDRETLVARARALDRVLLWNHYVIPQWHLGVDRVAWWDKFGRPAITPASGVRPMAWWAKDAAKK
ncbi:extracellular solute-binding protein [Magnetospirillum fulvum]|uniref:ABC-type oligopeptide transport system, periplasmic component n=1 Tax=Magnetospirillum fulvum MGU-K5 TaxID=1316936 RepID=S9TKW2_MAGFU|nr:ABC-type oligopeptide transport system, periplasmic component [Magnetospirillum fulvum MGU-K5]